MRWIITIAMIVTPPGATPAATICPVGDHVLAGLSDTVDVAAERRNYPEATAAMWVDGALWTANESESLTRWDIENGSYKQYRVSDGSVIRSPATADSALAAGTDTGLLWLLSSDRWRPMSSCADAMVTSIAWDSAGTFWYACPGEGLVRVTIAENTTRREVISGPDKVHSAIQSISAVAYDPAHATVWTATSSGDALRYDIYRQQ